MMKAQVLREQKPVEGRPLVLEDLPVPRPSEGEILIRVSACGVCHTDLHTVEGDLALAKCPIVPGHQIVGRVHDTGAGVSGVRRGARVGVAWLYASCGVCEFCRDGLENLCDAARFTGLHHDGGYAEYAVAPAAYCHAIPGRFTDLQAAPLLCAGIIGYRALRLCGIRRGGSLGLYGFGASAHVVVQIARHWGCKTFVFSRSREHRDHAMELGAEWAGQSDDVPPAPLDAGITFAPAGELVPAALRHLRKGGTLAINAIHMSDIPRFPYDLLRGERTIRSVTNLTRKDATEFLELAAAVPVATDVEVFAMEDANEALLRLKQSRIRGAAVLQPATDPPGAQ